jgi:hypothetical protein
MDQKPIRTVGELIKALSKLDSRLLILTEHDGIAVELEIVVRDNAVLKLKQYRYKKEIYEKD